MNGFGDWDDWSIRGQREMDPWIRNEIDLELTHVNVEGAIESQAGSDAGHNLRNQTIQMTVAGTVNVQFVFANIVDRLVVNDKCAVNRFHGIMRGQDGIVRLNDRCANLRGGINCDFQFALLSEFIFDGVHHQARESTSSTATERVEYKESL